MEWESVRCCGGANNGDWDRNSDPSSAHGAKVVTIALCGIKFFVERTLGKTFASLALMRPPKTHALPVVLSREEVRRMLAPVRLPVYRVCLITIYACGLRLLEGARLQVSAGKPFGCEAGCRASWGAGSTRSDPAPLEEGPGRVARCRIVVLSSRA
mgnify:CR=1 FL=1